MSASICKDEAEASVMANYNDVPMWLTRLTFMLIGPETRDNHMGLEFSLCGDKFCWAKGGAAAIFGQLLW